MRMISAVLYKYEPLSHSLRPHADSVFFKSVSLGIPRSSFA